MSSASLRKSCVRRRDELSKKNEMSLSYEGKYNLMLWQSVSL